MKRMVFIALILLAFVFTANPVFAHGNYDEEWERVDSLLEQQQPQSAVEIIDGIYREALARNDAAQIVKAHLYRSHSLNLREDESLLKVIAETEEAIAKTQTPAKNILHSIAAEFYWGYYTQNRGRILSRTATETTISDDIRAWDLRRLVEKCVEHHFAALSDTVILQRTALEPFSAMLEKADGSEKYRPTLYDFLAFRAVEFYAQNDANLTQPAERFSVNDPRYFAPAGDFSALSITTSDSLSFKFRALKLLQEIVAFHLNDPEPTALIDADLQRLDFVFKQSALPEKEQLYIDALQSMDTLYARHPASTEILFRIARTYNQQGNAFNPFTNPSVQWKKQAAMGVIEQAVARFPESFGAQNCLALKDEIKQPVVRLTADEAVLPGKPFLVSINYRNTALLHYKIVPVDFRQAFERRENEDGDMIGFYAGIKPVHNGEWTLPNSEDYQTHTIEVALSGLSEGYYAILASTDYSFSSDYFVVERSIWVSNISYVKQSISGGAYAVLVLHRETGKPLSGVSVQERFSKYNPDKRRYETKFGKIFRSNNKGLVRLSAGGKNSDIFYPYFINGKDQYADTAEYITLYPNRYKDSAKRPWTTVTFFSDRAIYRPGQTIYFKGIVLERNDRQTDVAANSIQTITLHGVHGVEISTISVTTNDFGSSLCANNSETPLPVVN